MQIDPKQPAPRVSNLEEAQFLIDALWRLVGEQAEEIAQLKHRILVLEEKLNTNLHNSSRPPSSGQKTGKPERLKSAATWLRRKSEMPMTGHSVVRWMALIAFEAFTVND